MSFETNQAGIQRDDLRTQTVGTLWASPAAAPALDSYIAFDASLWTPWGSLLTAEEVWTRRSGAPITIFTSWKISMAVLGIWFARDKDNYGVAETIGKWASLLLSMESNGLYQQIQPNIAYMNVQHRVAA